MLIRLGARERREAEFRALLDSAGFELTLVALTSLGFNVIDGTPR